MPTENVRGLPLPARQDTSSTRQIRELPLLARQDTPVCQDTTSPRLLTCTLASLATAGLLLLSYYPISFGWLGWVALVPLLYLVRSRASSWAIYLNAWLAGLIFFWPILSWLPTADYRNYYTWAALATYCSFYMPLAVWLVRRLGHGLHCPLILSVPIVWTALEYFRAHFLTGFAWYFLGHTQHAFLPLIQISDLAGAYAVTFLVAAVNAVIFECLYASRRLRNLLHLPEPASSSARFRLVVQCGVVALAVAATLSYGFWRIGQADFQRGPLVALIQSNVPQQIKEAAAQSGGSTEATNAMIADCLRLSTEAATRKPALIVWPETSFPGTWYQVAGVPSDRISAKWREAHDLTKGVARQLANWWGTDLLLGANSRFLGSNGEEWGHNSAFLIRKNGTLDGRYDKIHRVPFGEYVPFRHSMPFMNQFAPYDYDYSVSPGEHLTRFSLESFRFGVLICYEDTDTYLARQYVRQGDESIPDRLTRAITFGMYDDHRANVHGYEAPVDFFINISNDGWFDGTSEHEEHLAICRFRAVECRRSIARAVNMGISAVMDGNGKIIALPAATWGEAKKIAAALTCNIPIDQRASYYALWGDWLPWGCWLIIGLGLVSSAMRYRPRTIHKATHEESGKALQTK